MRGDGHSRPLWAARRGSYFFVIDAFIAAAILIFTIVLLNDLFIGAPRPEQEFNYANDFLSFMTDTQIRDYQEGNISLMIQQGNITDVRRTLAEQVLLFHNQSRDDLARQILTSSILILPPTLAINVTLTDNLPVNLFNRSLATVGNASTHLVVRSIEFILINNTDLHGPGILQVEVWA